MGRNVTRIERPKTLTEATADQLRSAIRSGELAPGSRLTQMETAKRLGVSSTPVREAFAALEHEGLVVSIPHKGIVVFEPTLGDLQEAYEIRQLLEGLAAERAAPLMTDADIHELSELLAQMESVQGGEAEHRRFLELNRVFHARIYSVAKMPRLERIIWDLRDSSEAYVAMHRFLGRDEAQTNADHAAIVEACRRRDAKRAGEATRVHLRHTMDGLSRELRSRSDGLAAAEM
jgi:DNA-binding GntR family transcriptional regulator